MACDPAKIGMSRFGDIAKVLHGWPFESDYFTVEDSELPIVVSIGNFNYTGGFRFGSTEIKRYTGTYPKEYELSPGDLLLIMTCQTAGGEILGVPARVPNDGQTYLHNQRIGKVVVGDSNSVDLGFLYYATLSKSFNQQLFASASGSKILHTSPGRIESTTIPLPPMAEQRRIAHILGTLDDKIELNRRMNATLEAMARALFQSWFVDFEPVRAKATGQTPAGIDPAMADLFPSEFENSELGRSPVGWKINGLDDVADFVNGLALQKYPPSTAETLPVIKIAQLRAGHAEGADRCGDNLESQYVVRDGDVLFSWSGSLLVDLWCGGQGGLNQHLFKVSSDQFPKWFYYLWTLHHLQGFRRIASSKATTMGHIQRHHLQAARVLVPEAGLLQKMTDTMQPLIDQMVSLRLQARTLAEIRDGLLPRLLSGQIAHPQPLLQSGGASK